uniref:ABC transporter permease n=1 Tax=Slackia heliotrinireducens TaxID=84110 RepID=UPI00331472AD
ERFATHIVEMNDGKVVSHRRLRTQTAAAKTAAAHAPRAKAKSASAVFELARRHLKNKRGRSIITTLVASIGILCIVLMSAINIGARAYMDEVATNSLISSPIEIKEDGTANALQSLSFDTGGLLAQGAAEGETPTAVTAGMQAQIMLYAALENRQECDLSSFITHLDLSESDIRNNAFDVQMRYPIELNVYDRNNNQIVKAGKATILRNIDPSTIFGEQATEIIEQKLPDPANLMRQFVINDETGETPYELLAGRYPESYDELVIITARDGSVSDYFIYAAGIEDYHTLVDAATDITMGNDFEIPEQTPSYSFDDLLGLTYKVVPTCDYYYKENGIWQDGRSQKDFRKKLLADATELTVVGIVRPNEAIDNGTEIGTLAYDEGLIPYLVDAANDSEIVQEQLADPEYDVLTGESFSATPATEAQRADFENTKQALLDAMDPELFSDYKRQLIESLSYSQVIALKQQLGGYMNADGSLNVSEGDIRQIAALPDSTFAAFLEQYAPSSLNAGYKKNLDALGAVDLMKPTEIDIYAKSMDANDAILAEIEKYNEHMELTGANSAPLATSNSNSALLARVTSVTGTIVRVLAVLIVIALAMSMFMVFSVTYVSSIERRREIGILRAMGSTRRDIVRLFDYENLVIGAFAGVVGTIVSFLLQPLLNLLTLFLTAQTGLCHVPLWIVFPAVLLGALIAVLAGHIPARRAAASDPVELLH